MAQEIIKIPPAKSLIFGLRSIGYNFSTALADIIDNSISAEAKNAFTKISIAKTISEIICLFHLLLSRLKTI